MADPAVSNVWLPAAVDVLPEVPAIAIGNWTPVLEP